MYIREPMLRIWLRTSAGTIDQLPRYSIVSAIAYAADILTLFVLTDVLGVFYLSSAAIAYILGTAINYGLSVTLVFNKRRMDSRTREFLVFALVGVTGLGITELLIWLMVDYASTHYLLAKIVSTSFIFLAKFIVRKYLLFS